MINVCIKANHSEDCIFFRLRHMWQTMCECHKVQNHLSQQLNHLTSQQSIDCTSEYRWQAAIQLKTEVTSWYNSLCRVINSQHEYVKTLCSWIQLANCLRDGDQQSRFSSAVHSLSEEWLTSLEKLPDKVSSFPFLLLLFFLFFFFWFFKSLFS